jgi:hypothetical protein
MKLTRATAAPTIDPRLIDTRFDFLVGSYKRARRVRLAALMAVSVCVIAATAIVAQSITVVLGNEELRSQIASSESSLTQLTAQLNEKAPAGTSEEQLLNVIRSNGQGAIAAARTQPAIATLLTDLVTAANGIGTISEITIDPVASNAKGGIDASSFTITVRFSSTSFANQAAWISRLKALTYLTNQTATTAGTADGPTGLSVTSSMTLSATDTELVAALTKAFGTPGQQASTPAAPTSPTTPVGQQPTTPETAPAVPGDNFTGIGAE